MVNKLFYNKPPNDWNEALPVGNGKLGAMLFGDSEKDRIQLNEDSLWSGGFRERTNELSKKYINEIRSLLMEKRIPEAENLVKETMWPYLPHSTHYQSAGDIWIDYTNTEPLRADKLEKDEMGIPRIVKEKSPLENYYRELNLENGKWSAFYKKNNNKINIESFVSHNNNVLVYKIRGDQLSCVINYTRKDLGKGKNASYIDITKVIDDNIIIAEGHNGAKKSGISYSIGIKVCQEGGTQQSNGAGIVIKNADEILLYVTIRTSFRDDTPSKYCVDKLKKLSFANYYDIHNEHLNFFKKQLSTFNLNLNKPNLEKMPIDELIDSVKQNPYSDNFVYLTELYVNYARYLLISSSYSDSLPSNLQGIWNQELAPSWGSRYTLNVNTQMNYSIALQMGLDDTVLPLLEHLNRMLPRGQKVAEEMYGIQGFVTHHTTDIWGDSAPQDQNLTCTIWPMGGAWLSLYIWDYYQYNHDIEVLTKYFKVIEESAKFFDAYLFRDNKGNWTTGPSASPENYYQTDNIIGSLTNGPAMDLQIIKDLFHAYILSARVLEIDTELLDNIIKKYNEISGISLNSDGKIMEWNEDYQNVDKGHRHISHLYALHPSRQIRRQDKKLIRGAKLTLQERLENGGGHTGWSAAWILSLWNRMGESEKAYNSLAELLSNSYSNLFSKHPPFQIDGNFGGAEGILQFFVQQENDKVLLLPSLPKRFDSGEIIGYKTKFGVEINFKWRDGKIICLEIISLRDTSVQIEIFYDNNSSTFTKKLEKGRTYKYTSNDIYHEM